MLGYLRGAADVPRTLGHSPLGSLSVWALLAVVGTSAVSGLFATDEISYEGPWTRAVSEATSLLLTTVHKQAEPVLYALVGLHLAAIVYYRVRRGQDLVRPMITGDKPVESDWPAARDDAMLRLRALALLAVAAAVVWLAVMVGAPAAD